MFHLFFLFFCVALDTSLTFELFASVTPNCLEFCPRASSGSLGHLVIFQLLTTHRVGLQAAPRAFDNDTSSLSI